MLSLVQRVDMVMMMLTELGGHYVMNASYTTQAEGDDITVSNDFRQIGLVVDPTTFGTSTVASSTTARQTYVVKIKYIWNI